VHDTCYRIMRLVYADRDEGEGESGEAEHGEDDSYRRSLQWQREFLGHACRLHSSRERLSGEEAAAAAAPGTEAPSTEALGTVCDHMLRAASRDPARPRCVRWSLEALRRASPPSPYSARLLASSPRTRQTFATFSDIAGDICRHPDHSSSDDARLLSKLVLHHEDVLSGSDVYSEGPGPLHSTESTPLPAGGGAAAGAETPPTPSPAASSPRAPPRILCVFSTYTANHLLAMTAVELWGSKCTGMLAYSNATDWYIPVVKLEYEGDEHYDTIWNKFQAVYAEVFRSYRHDFDYFFFGDDDTYVVVPNLFHFIKNKASQMDYTYAGRPIFNAQHNIYYASGGGFVLDRVVLQSLITELALGDDDARENQTIGHNLADVKLALALRRQGVYAMDTRDERLEHTFHHLSPWQVLRYTGEPGDGVEIGNYYRVCSLGFIAGREGCSRDSALFHKVVHPTHMRVMDAILTVCRTL
jgi:glycoprotein-N-acetylgalactosamine 3-beta-galactosyltransferase